MGKDWKPFWIWRVILDYRLRDDVISLISTYLRNKRLIRGSDLADERLLCLEVEVRQTEMERGTEV